MSIQVNSQKRSRFPANWTDFGRNVAEAVAVEPSVVEPRNEEPIVRDPVVGEPLGEELDVTQDAVVTDPIVADPNAADRDAEPSALLPERNHDATRCPAIECHHVAASSDPGAPTLHIAQQRAVLPVIASSLSHRRIAVTERLHALEKRNKEYVSIVQEINDSRLAEDHARYSASTRRRAQEEQERVGLERAVLHAQWKCEDVDVQVKGLKGKLERLITEGAPEEDVSRERQALKNAFHIKIECRVEKRGAARVLQSFDSRISAAIVADARDNRVLRCARSAEDKTRALSQAARAKLSILTTTDAAKLFELQSRLKRDETAQLAKEAWFAQPIETRKSTKRKTMGCTQGSAVDVVPSDCAAGDLPSRNESGGEVYTSEGMPNTNVNAVALVETVFRAEHEDDSECAATVLDDDDDDDNNDDEDNDNDSNDGPADEGGDDDFAGGGGGNSDNRRGGNGGGVGISVDEGRSGDNHMGDDGENNLTDDEDANHPEVGCDNGGGDCFAPISPIASSSHLVPMMVVTEQDNTLGECAVDLCHTAMRPKAVAAQPGCTSRGSSRVRDRLHSRGAGKRHKLVCNDPHHPGEGKRKDRCMVCTPSMFCMAENHGHQSALKANCAMCTPGLLCSVVEHLAFGKRKRYCSKCRTTVCNP